MGGLAWALRRAPSNITHRVRRLEKRGLLVRRTDPDDGRVVLARLTPKGLRLLRDARPLALEGVRGHFLDHIDPKDLASVAEIFATIAASTHPTRRRACPAGPFLSLYTRGATRLRQHAPSCLDQ